MCTGWQICKTLGTHEKLHVQSFIASYCFFNFNINFLAAQDPICIQRPQPPNLYLPAPAPNPYLSVHSPQFVLTGSGQNRDNKSQRLHIMLLYLFLLSNSFVTVIGCCSLLLLYLRLLFIIDFIGYLSFPTLGPGPGPRSSISIYW